MKAIRIHETGDATKLTYEEAPLPQPKAGEVRVKVTAAGLNYIETYSARASILYPCPSSRAASSPGPSTRSVRA